MGTTFVTKRAHKKSRGGCQVCKIKKIKCNEAQPSCGFCEKRKLKCVYVDHKSMPKLDPTPETPASSSSSSSGNSDCSSTDGESDGQISKQSWSLTQISAPAISCSYGNLSSLDVRLMHHWATSTWRTMIPSNHADEVMLVHAPQLGFSNDFLLSCILGISSLHQEHLYPQSAEIRQQTALYRVRALHSYREHLPKLDLESGGWEAALLMSILLIPLCSKNYHKSADEIGVINWLILYQGLQTVIKMKEDPGLEIFQSNRVAAVFKRELTPLQTVPVVPALLLRMVEKITPFDSDYVYLESYCTALDNLGILYASLRQDDISPALFVRIIAYPSFLIPEFTICAREKRPRTLIILAYFLVFLKLCNHIWYITDTVDSQIMSISKLLGMEWAPFLEVPLEATCLDNAQDLRTLLLR